MEYKYLDCDFQPCELYTSLDSKKCEYIKENIGGKYNKPKPKPSSRMNRGYTEYGPIYPGAHIFRARY